MFLSGIPQNYFLLPISTIVKTLKMKVDVKPDIKCISEKQVNKFANKFERINQSKQLIYDLVAEYKLNNPIIPDAANKKVEDFKGYLNTIESSLKAKLSSALIKIRSGIQTEDVLEEIYDQFNNEESSISAVEKNLQVFVNSSI